MLADDSYIHIEAFMRTGLHLKGNELLVYAIIHGFSHSNGGEFVGSLKYIADWIGISKKAVQTILKKLVEKGLLIKKDYFEKNVKYCKYKAVVIKTRGMEKTSLGMEESSIGYGKNFPRGMEESSTNTILINNNDTISKDRLRASTQANIPTLEEVIEYYHKKQLDVPPANFFASMERKGWKYTDGEPIKDWKSVYNNFSPYPDEEYNPDYRNEIPEGII